AERAGGVAGRPVQVLDRQHDLDGRVGLRLPGLGADQLDQFVAAARDEPLPVEQPAFAAAETQSAPPFLGAAGGADGPGEFGRALHGVLADRLAGARVVGREHTRSVPASRVRCQAWLRGLGHRSPLRTVVPPTPHPKRAGLAGRNTGCPTDERVTLSPGNHTIAAATRPTRTVARPARPTRRVRPAAIPRGPNLTDKM